ncbi:MAG: hypothetical protein SA339_05255 [Methanomassiliicoccus sp.]|nr:hypothetical protein [Methanomassiliicoccus sp.]
MATESLRCSKCSKPFVKMRAANGVRTILSVITMGILFLGIMEFAWEEPLYPGITFASLNTMIAAFVVFVLVNVAADQTIRDEKKKRTVSGSLLCDECKVKYNAEVEQKKVDEQNELQRWIAELEAMKSKDPALRNIIVEWSTANAGATPDRGTVGEFQTAMNLEKAGNYEGAAQIFERHKLWTYAGKAREKDRVQMIKHVTVDMNQLLEQIGTKGLAIPYKCQNCGAGITIDKNSSASGLKFCSYCGTAYNIEDMSRIVQEALAI